MFAQAKFSNYTLPVCDGSWSRVYMYDLKLSIHVWYSINCPATKLELNFGSHALFESFVSIGYSKNYMIVCYEIIQS